MPGNASHVIDQAATYQTVILMGCMPRTKFQSDENDTTTDGIQKWTVGAATSTSHPVGGMPASTEVINVPIAALSDPCQDILMGSAITLDELRVGVSPPERTDKASGRPPVLFGSGRPRR